MSEDAPIHEPQKSQQEQVNHDAELNHDDQQPQMDIEAAKQFVLAQIQSGVQKPRIVDQLTEQGVDQDVAAALVDAVHAAVEDAIQRERFGVPHVLGAISGGVVAALVAGGIWGAIAIGTGYEVGYAAWGVGLLCGVAVLLASGGKRGRLLQLAAAACSILGILVGKYITFFYFVKEAVANKHGADVAARISPFAQAVLQVFAEGLVETLSGFDALWVLLAVLTAWKIPQASGIRIPDSPDRPVT